jgi:hypothetical protein
MTNSRTNSPTPSQNGDVRSGSDFLNLGSWSRQHRPDDGPLNKLGTMSLGPPSQRKKGKVALLLRFWQTVITVYTIMCRSCLGYCLENIVFLGAFSLCFSLLSFQHVEQPSDVNDQPPDVKSFKTCSETAADKSS